LEFDDGHGTGRVFVKRDNLVGGIGSLAAYTFKFAAHTEQKRIQRMASS